MTRHVFDFSEQAYQRLQEIQKASGDATEVQTIEEALEVYDWLVLELAKGSRVMRTSSEGKVEEIHFLLHHTLGGG